MFVEVGISYNSDHDLASDLMQKACEAHPDAIDNRTNEEKEQGIPKVVIRLIELGDSAQVLRAYVWAKDPMTGFFMKCDLLKSIKKSFDQNAIEIPFPHRTVYLRNESK
jgi:small-conductance mechanosensitive channel